MNLSDKDLQIIENSLVIREELCEPRVDDDVTVLSSVHHVDKIFQN